MKRHGKLNSLPQRSLVNHQEERDGAVLGCLVQQEKGKVKHGHIYLWRIIPLREATRSEYMIRRWNSIPMMRR